MKSYTNLHQSKKLARILPKESADQTWEIIAIAGANLNVPEEMEYLHNGNIPYTLSSRGGVPCWSLAALIDILPNGTETHKQVNESISCYFVEVYNNKKYFSTERHDDLVDACVEMIIKLYEKNLL